MCPQFLYKNHHQPCISKKKTRRKTKGAVYDRFFETKSSERKQIQTKNDCQWHGKSFSMCEKHKYETIIVKIPGTINAGFPPANEAQNLTNPLIARTTFTFQLLSYCTLKTLVVQLTYKAQKRKNKIHVVRSYQSDWIHAWPMVLTDNYHMIIEWKTCRCQLLLRFRFPPRNLLRIL